MTDTSSAEQWAQAVLNGEAPVQPGTLNLRVLGQDRIWIDETGRVHLLAEMDETYLTNVLSFLLVRARALQRRLAIARVCELLDSVDADLDPIEIGHIAVLAIDLLEEEDPATWLNATPLATANHQPPHPPTARILPRVRLRNACQPRQLNVNQ